MLMMNGGFLPEESLGNWNLAKQKDIPQKKKKEIKKERPLKM